MIARFMARFRRATESDGVRRRYTAKRVCTLAGITILLILLAPGTAQAYIGPGAGFALAGSFLAVFAAVASAPTALEMEARR